MLHSATGTHCRESTVASTFQLLTDARLHSATAGLAEHGGRGSNGGVWEWTSTVLDTHPGFAGTSIFPGYSSDFFDTKHQVVVSVRPSQVSAVSLIRLSQLGASYATIPRLAERSTVRNFYQRNYPYAWVGARVAYDMN